MLYYVSTDSYTLNQINVTGWIWVQLIKKLLYMRILINIGHPAHVHFFKYFIWEMKKKGHEILISTVDKEVTLSLLEAYDFDYELCGKRGSNIFGFARELIKRDYHVYKLTRKFNPDVIIGISDLFGAHVSKITKAKSIVFTDSEPATLINLITFPFTDVVCTPEYFSKDLGKKHVRYKGYHELSYLHNKYFTPDPSTLNELGLAENERFIVLRFVSWQATHDIGQYGFDIQSKRQLIKEISKYARIFITSESPLEYEFEKYKITASPEKIHDLLYFASMLIGDSQTMTTEAAVLGTPAIRCNSFVGPKDMSNFIELEQKYDLIYSFREPERAIDKAIELLQKPNLKEQWAKKRETLLADKVDVTQYMIDFIENYPESFAEYKRQKSRTQ